jgi:hypothetical protein
MAVLHEEVDAVLLEGDGVGVGLGNALNDLNIFYVELEAARGTLVCAHFAGDDDGRLLGEAFEGFKDSGRDALDVGYALNGSGAVAKDGEEKFAALAEVVEPSAKGDGLAFVLAEGGDGGNGSGWSYGGGFFGHGCLCFPGGQDVRTY